ncbi:hypothetical protein [Streptomyces sp. NBC_01314]|uniref:hypothetical protein n=1 Tax=Streptomyces sp. NBC_01314 TaxID=2903821 RepID=UPI0030887D9A|nr:hypothetical protein OG622_04685 [Streptomyces sp. NBC_01314]
MLVPPTVIPNSSAMSWTTSAAAPQLVREVLDRARPGIQGLLGVPRNSPTAAAPRWLPEKRWAPG